MRKYTSLNIEKIRVDFPLSVKKLLEWTYAEDKLGEGEDPTKIPQAEKEKIIDFTLALNPRMLFDFFDDMGIYITIDSDEGIFRHSNNLSTYSESATNRNDAEEKAFMTAFTELEKKTKELWKKSE